ncbi:MAG: hypothetical protein MJY89_00215 [Bacteroidales bacterium]|nr:hypothetical protein [Bacteroidales bacterium]
MSERDALMLANADIMTIIAHAKKIGWDTISYNSLQRVVYMMKVLYSFNHDDENVFSLYHFSVSIFGPYSELVDKSLTFLLSSQRLLGDREGDVRLNSMDGVDAVAEDKIKWIDTILLILSRYGESKIFSFIVNDPQYEQSVKANINSEINANPENDTLKVLNDFKRAFEDTLEDTSSISKEEYISLYFDYLFSQIINKK